MKITVKYDRKDFFGFSEYTEDYIVVTSNETALKALKKAFKLILEQTESVMYISEYDGAEMTLRQEYSDRENDIVTLREIESYNSYTERKISKQAAQKLIRNISQVEKEA